MKQICGIYKITNLIDEKFYIGQSIHIFNRWKQHTQSLYKIISPELESPLRRAFIEKGLLEQISQEGVYNNFKFEIIEECSKDKLTEREYSWIDKLNPAYNRMMCPPDVDRMWPQKESLSESCYIQYHDCNARNYYPFWSTFIENKWNPESSAVYTKKRDALRMKGAKLYLILGLKQKGQKKKNFFLWGYTQIEEIECVNDEYLLIGTEFHTKEPIKINDIDGFNYFFRHTMGSFAYGLQNAVNDPFHKVIKNEKTYMDENNLNLATPINWFYNFQSKFITDDNWILIDNNLKPNLYTYTDEKIAFVNNLLLNMLVFYPQKAAGLLLNSNCFKLIFLWPYIDDLSEFLSLIPEIKVLIIKIYADTKNDELTKEQTAMFDSLVSKYPNVSLADDLNDEDLM